MSKSVEKRNFTSIQTLMADAINEMCGDGDFKLESVNGSNVNPTLDGTGKKILISATKQSDPLALSDADSADPLYPRKQPWGIYFEVEDDEAEDGTGGWMNIHVATPTNFIDDGSGNIRVATSYDVGTAPNNEISLCGRLTAESRVSSTKTKSFIHDNVESTRFPPPLKDRLTWRYEHWGFDLKRLDEEALPLSYRLSITDHGIMFCMWAEGYDGAGDRYMWFNIQRMVDSAGATITSGKAPLFCVFSLNGGGGDDLNTIDPDGILKFVVREHDVNTPTVPHSAIIDTADSTRIINSVQQVAIGEDNKFILNFPKGLNTDRFSYPHELDMFVTSSADVISQYSEVEVSVYGEAQPRKYKAMNANHENNKGMRLLMLVEGATIPAA